MDWIVSSNGDDLANRSHEEDRMIAGDTNHHTRQKDSGEKLRRWSGSWRKRIKGENRSERDRKRERCSHPTGSLFLSPYLSFSTSHTFSLLLHILSIKNQKKISSQVSIITGCERTSHWNLCSTGIFRTVSFFPRIPPSHRTQGSRHKVFERESCKELGNKQQIFSLSFLTLRRPWLFLHESENEAGKRQDTVFQVRGSHQHSHSISSFSFHSNFLFSQFISLSNKEFRSLSSTEIILEKRKVGQLAKNQLLLFVFWYL